MFFSFTQLLTIYSSISVVKKAFATDIVSATKNEVNTETPEFSMLSHEFDAFVQKKIQDIPKPAREVFIMNKIEKNVF